jgi:hypothetical protein
MIGITLVGYVLVGTFISFYFIKILNEFDIEIAGTIAQAGVTTGVMLVWPCFLVIICLGFLGLLIDFLLEKAERVIRNCFRSESPRWEDAHPSGVQLHDESQYLRKNGCTIAVRYADGSEAWSGEKGGFHREDGPAYSSGDGYEAWYWHDELHRADGPAVTFTDGTVEYWIHGERLTEEEWRKR